MNTETLIRDKLSALSPSHVDILNESHMHAGPAIDSHFKLTVVSETFVGLRAVQRHQKVYGLLRDELAGPVHALSLHLFTAEEWETASVPASPSCQGAHQ
ncbi:MAG: BolA family transcriptional regulator [Oceanobacter sp.]